MIRIGLPDTEKQLVFNDYLNNNDINKVFVFQPSNFQVNINTNIAIEYVDYKDIIMYKFFYRLLEVIDNKTLLIFNECLRTQNRSDLTYNCAHHYCNQTEHKLIFEYFPFINDDSDFMILLDLQNKGRYKGKSFDYGFLNNEDIQVIPTILSLQLINLQLDDSILKKYEIKKEQLFNNLGNSDPDTIPRQLHVWAGNFKKNIINPDMQYVARNDRLKLPNVTTYKNAEHKKYTIIDFPHNRINFNDFLKLTEITDIVFINSGLKVDLFYISEFRNWTERLGSFYAKTSLYARKGT